MNPSPGTYTCDELFLLSSSLIVVLMLNAIHTNILSVFLAYVFLLLLFLLSISLSPSFSFFFCTPLVVLCLSLLLFLLLSFFLLLDLFLSFSFFTYTFSYTFLSLFPPVSISLSVSFMLSLFFSLFFSFSCYLFLTSTCLPISSLCVSAAVAACYSLLLLPQCWSLLPADVTVLLPFSVALHRCYHTTHCCCCNYSEV